MIYDPALINEPTVTISPLPVRFRGRGLWRQEWVSICSAHPDFVAEGCPRCAAGCYRNVWAERFSRAVFNLSPGLWQWWVNR